MGYIHKSRSENSKQAILRYEAPISWYTQEYIEKFLWEPLWKLNRYYHDNYGFELTRETMYALKLVSISCWKKAAQEVGATSWHHTGPNYRKTAHYDLYKVLPRVLSITEKKCGGILRKYVSRTSSAS